MIFYRHADHDDQRDEPQILDLERPQQVAIDELGQTRRRRQHEADGQPHADRALDAARAAHERADAEELHEHEIVDERGAERDEQELAHR